MRILLSIFSVLALAGTVALVAVAVWFAQSGTAPDGAVLRAGIGAGVFLLLSVGTGWVPVRSIVASSRTYIASRTVDTASQTSDSA